MSVQIQSTKVQTDGADEMIKLLCGFLFNLIPTLYRGMVEYHSFRASPLRDSLIFPSMYSRGRLFFFFLSKIVTLPRLSHFTGGETEEEKG